MTELCRWTNTGYRLRSHLATCRDSDCAGCTPCERDEYGDPTHHCTARRTCAGHIGARDLTCPRCIGRTRNDITQIVTLAALMLGEAVEVGIESEAANLAGPAADPARWSERTAALRRLIYEHVPEANVERAIGVLIEDDDEHHPYSVLTRWEMALREDYGQAGGVTSTSGAAGWLDRHLSRIANDPDQDWALFVAEMARCRAHLEAVLHDSRVPEQGRPCPSCDDRPKLQKHYVDHDVTGALDYWKCPACAARWSEGDYRLRVESDYLRHADRLTASQLQAAYTIKASSVTGWAAKGLVRKSGRDSLGRQLYVVADARKQAGQVTA